MSEDQLRMFMEAVKSDTTLSEKLTSADHPDAIVAIAKAAGFAISAEDLREAQAELSDEDLEGVTGGSYWTMRKNTYGCPFACKRT